MEALTNENRGFSIDAEKHGDPYQPELGSKVLVSVFGRSDSEINCLGFALLRRTSAQLTDVQYPDISTLLVTTKPSQIGSITYQNLGAIEENFTFGGSVTVTTEQSFTLYFTFRYLNCNISWYVPSDCSQGNAFL